MKTGPVIMLIVGAVLSLLGFSLAIAGATAAVVNAQGDQDFGVSSAEGSGSQEIDWDLTGGSWAVGVMNADASPGVSTALQVGVRIGFLGPLAVALLLLGLLILLVGLVLTVLGAGGLGRGTRQPAHSSTSGCCAGAGGFRSTPTRHRPAPSVQPGIVGRRPGRRRHPGGRNRAGVTVGR